MNKDVVCAEIPSIYTEIAENGGDDLRLASHEPVERHSRRCSGKHRHFLVGILCRLDRLGDLRVATFRDAIDHPNIAGGTLDTAVLNSKISVNFDIHSLVNSFLEDCRSAPSAATDMPAHDPVTSAFSTTSSLPSPTDLPFRCGGPASDNSDDK